MNIAILGTGNVGTGLVKVFLKTKHNILLGSRDNDNAITLASDLSKEAPPKGGSVKGVTVKEALANASVVFLAVPYDAIVELINQSGIDISGKTLIDVSNPLTADFMALTLGYQTSAAEELQKALPNAAIVKAFNTVFAQILHEGPKFANQQVPVYVASDHEGAKADVIALIDESGFEGVDAGITKNARYLEPMAAMNIQFGYVLGKGTQVTPAWIAR